MLLVEWRDARQAIFDCRLSKDDPGWTALFVRLGRAENDLMELARLVPVKTKFDHSACLDCLDELEHYGDKTS